jgi:hypothetical protein
MMPPFIGAGALAACDALTSRTSNSVSDRDSIFPDHHSRIFNDACRTVGLIVIAHLQ